ncbi:hypothetical protein V6N11_045302 [Hibiscus sabdariffa]|uniref:Uncharacterized protein n=1 Tax=Hibiscus sabdariffa TaxID=183260 RepID=A0ABR2Q0I1_9ROSI
MDLQATSTSSLVSSNNEVYLSVGGMMLLVLAFVADAIPVPNLFLSEMFLGRIRDKTMSIYMTEHWVINFFVGLSLLQLTIARFMYQRVATFSSSLGNRHIENWADSGLADNSQLTDISIDVNTNHKIQFHRVRHEPVMVDSVDQFKLKCDDQKNQEVTRKSILKEKEYVQQLENSQLRLTE